MTRTEQIKMAQRAGRYIRYSQELNHTAFATVLIGVPLSMAAIMGYSPWPGVIFWAASWWAHTLTKYFTAVAKELHAIVQRARDSEEDKHGQR